MNQVRIGEGRRISGAAASLRRWRACWEFGTVGRRVRYRDAMRAWQDAQRGVGSLLIRHYGWSDPSRLRWVLA